MRVRTEAHREQDELVGIVVGGGGGLQIREGITLSAENVVLKIKVFYE